MFQNLLHSKNFRTQQISSGAGSGALDAHLGHVTGDLMLVVETWAKLTEAMREKILVMIRNVE